MSCYTTPHNIAIKVNKKVWLFLGLTVLPSAFYKVIIKMDINKVLQSTAITLPVYTLS